MKNLTSSRQVLIIIVVFIFSRLLAMFMGLHMNPRPIYVYWQYLDLETLKHHLLNGVWYDHAQPPAFNLFLGIVLKIGGEQSTVLFALFLKLISLANTLLIFSILRKLVTSLYIPFILAMVYLLSPATLVYECELFYTTTISFLLLLSVFYLVRFTWSGKESQLIGIFLPLTLLCLSRSVYHLLWLSIVLVCLLYYFRKNTSWNKLLLASITSLILVSSWYIKNKLIFGKFTTSTWVGMNLARNVFHDNEITDSSRIEAYEPFSRISRYRKFIDPRFELSYKGLNDRDLLQEMKNDSFINETEVSYIRVSELYQEASIRHIRAHPMAYASNVFQSSILYFTPATLYSLPVKETAKIKMYDVLYSFNLTHFAHSKQQRRILLTISAIPKLLFYFLVIFLLIRYCVQNRSIMPWNLLILLTIGFIFGVSSFFEHFENMRFRYETEPLFLILAGQVFSRLYSRFQIRRKPPIKELIA
jgi:hypothetical protein